MNTRTPVSSNRAHFPGTTLLLLVALTTGSSVQAQAREADIVIATFTVEGDSAGVLRAAADSCLNRMLRNLKASGIVALHSARLTEKTLRDARPAPWALVGHLKRSKGVVDIELRVLEVASGDEMVSYMNSGKDAQVVARISEPAAPRLVRFIQERKAAR